MSVWSREKSLLKTKQLLPVCVENTDGPVGRLRRQQFPHGHSALRSTNQVWQFTWQFKFSKCWKNGCVSTESVCVHTLVVPTHPSQIPSENVSVLFVSGDWKVLWHLICWHVDKADQVMVAAVFIRQCISLLWPDVMCYWISQNAFTLPLGRAKV